MRNADSIADWDPKSAVRALERNVVVGQRLRRVGARRGNMAAHGVLAATLFHFRGTTIPEARAYLRGRGYAVRP